MPRRVSSLLSVVLALMLAACAGDDQQAAPPVAALRAEACRALAPSSSPGATLPESGLALPTDVSPLSGVIVAPDGIFTLDLALGHLWRLRDDGTVVYRVGRTGRGPAEFDAPFLASSGGRFLARHGDTLMIFDSRSMHRFTTGGEHLESRQVPPAALSFLESPRTFALADGKPIVESLASLAREGGRTVRLPERRFTLSRVEGDSIEVIERLLLPQLPRTGSGGYFGSPAEAHPVWDIRDGCLALMDGSTPRLIVGDVRTGARDTIVLALPERFADAGKANATLPGIEPGAELPAPSLPARVIDLRLDASGVIWLRPVQPDRLAGDGAGPADGLEAWLYDLRSGHFTIDTILGFPTTFDAAGRGVRVTTDDEGVTRLVPLAKLPE